MNWRHINHQVNSGEQNFLRLLGSLLLIVLWMTRPTLCCSTKSFGNISVRYDPSDAETDPKREKGNKNKKTRLRSFLIKRLLFCGINRKKENIFFCLYCFFQRFLPRPLKTKIGCQPSSFFLRKQHLTRDGAFRCWLTTIRGITWLDTMDYVVTIAIATTFSEQQFGSNYHRTYSP